MNNKKRDNVISFDKNWQKSLEIYYNHWTRKEPQNQIQLAFRNHWTLFRELMNNKFFNGGKRCLEVGCGRGTISEYFSDHGYHCTLLDLSEYALQRAKEIFSLNHLKGTFTIGDVNYLNFKDNSFDVVVSIGLLEHFSDIEPPIKEQIRVLDTGGIFLGYIVPKYRNNIQNKYEWINKILKAYVNKDCKISPKKEFFRSDKGSAKYKQIMKKYNLKAINSSGVYPLPMISDSIEFPFTLMPDESEKAIVKHFNSILHQREKKGGHPWLCKEGYGQAFLVWGFK